MSLSLFFVAFLFVGSGGTTEVSLSASDRELYQKYGLSETEWRLVREHGIELDELQEIMGIGLSLRDYVNRPWETLGLSRSRYLGLLRRGHTGEAVASMSSRQSSSEYEVIGAFLLPGRYQFKRGQYLKGSAMTLGCASSLGLFAFHHKTRRPGRMLAFDRPFPWLFTMVGCMLWSSIDTGMQHHRERSNKSVRFSLAADTDGVQVTALLVF